MNTEAIMILLEIESNIKDIEDNTTLYEEINFDSRTDAIDFIDFHVIDRIEGLLQKAELKAELAILKRRAEKTKSELEKVDANLFKRIREKIKTGAYTKASFSKMIRRYNDTEIYTADQIGYNNLDVFINGLLYDKIIPEATLNRQPEMVFYQQTPARIIFEMAERADLKPNDVFFDLGSGLGQVAILMGLISDATVKGIEFEPAYYNYAKTYASQLNLPQVEFINADALKWDYSHGTVFFMYTPFGGSMLQDMLNILQKESQKRRIIIFTYGPCSPLVARQSWLDCVNGSADNIYKLYEFRSL
ncbi:class I SAM-dependent methyltransferase [Mucilaginibacter sabulilitoris]|uniref:Class I SAM-dependent methyltransferase n=1 Tax=Mucilaginibacter sabulilitoris TaxID=1173583 RepID=A0ABZ0TVE3_9SPHI|nr:class I SAM-dependent methyltransferase [Mucilaginibacter sabulilitoris]WPU97081.1 class I SAM-dependent methyltransferase [Mucilaginibacter sabulilitoris]